MMFWGGWYFQNYGRSSEGVCRFSNCLSFGQRKSNEQISFKKGVKKRGPAFSFSFPYCCIRFESYDDCDDKSKFVYWL